MPVLHERIDRSGLFIAATGPTGEQQVYAITPEGERFLTLVLGVKPGDAFRSADLDLLVDRSWASPLESTSPSSAEPIAEVVEPRPAPPTPVLSAPAIARTPSSRRSRAREVALQVLYLLEHNPSIDKQLLHDFLERRLRESKLVGFSSELVAGVREHQPHIDGLISDVAENWRIDRMAAIDRNILRLGAYELLYCPKIPARVAINEALELAKRYSTAQSSRFVNGILDRLQSADREDDPAPLIPAPSEEPPGATPIEPESQPEPEPSDG